MPPAPGAHPRIEWVSVHSCSSTRLVTSPWATRVTSTSPGRTWAASRTSRLGGARQAIARPRTFRGSAFPAVAARPRAFSRPRPGEPSRPVQAIRGIVEALFQIAKRLQRPAERGPRRHLIDPLPSRVDPPPPSIPQSAAHVAKRSQHVLPPRVSSPTAAEASRLDVRHVVRESLRRSRAPPPRSRERCIQRWRRPRSPR